MSDSKTVFVIGAGASAEAGLPTGDKLKKIISERLSYETPRTGGTYSGDERLLQAFSYREELNRTNAGANGLTRYLTEASHIHKHLVLSPSIDNFIDQHRGNEVLEFVAKAAIVRSILEAERASHLYPIRIPSREPEIDFNALSSTWYMRFYYLVTQNCGFEDLPRRLERLTLIIFNYDRCAEFFLKNALKAHYRRDETEVAEVMNHLKIYHPYGSIGTSDFADFPVEVEFGEGQISRDKLVDLTRHIKTFSEGTDSATSPNSMLKQEVHDAKTLVFLGFTFRELNMRLIAPLYDPKDPIKITQVFATAFESSESDIRSMQFQAKSLTGGKPTAEAHIENLKCFDFFNHFSLSLDF